MVRKSEYPFWKDNAGFLSRKLWRIHYSFSKMMMYLETCGKGLHRGQRLEGVEDKREIRRQLSWCIHSRKFDQRAHFGRPNRVAAEDLDQPEQGVDVFGGDAEGNELKKRRKKKEPLENKMHHSVVPWGSSQQHPEHKHASCWCHFAGPCWSSRARMDPAICRPWGRTRRRRPERWTGFRWQWCTNQSQTLGLCWAWRISALRTARAIISCRRLFST